MTLKEREDIFAMKEIRKYMSLTLTVNGVKSEEIILDDRESKTVYKDNENA